jgi:hypothetical protein
MGEGSVLSRRIEPLPQRSDPYGRPQAQKPGSRSGDPMRAEARTHTQQLVVVAARQCRVSSSGESDRVIAQHAGHRSSELRRQPGLGPLRHQGHVVISEPDVPFRVALPPRAAAYPLLARMLSEAADDTRTVDEGAPCEVEAKVEVRLLPLGKSLVEATDSAHPASSMKGLHRVDVRDDDVLGHADRVPVAARVRRGVLGELITVAVDVNAVTEDQADLVAEGRKATFDRFGHEHVVGVQELDELPSGESNTFVSGRTGAQVGARSDREPLSVAAYDPQAVVRGSVVDDHDLDIRVRLRERAVDRVSQVFLRVETWDDDGDESGSALAIAPGTAVPCAAERFLVGQAVSPRFSVDRLSAAGRRGTGVPVGARLSEAGPAGLPMGRLVLHGHLMQRVCDLYGW